MALKCPRLREWFGADSAREWPDVLVTHVVHDKARALGEDSVTAIILTYVVSNSHANIIFCCFCTKFVRRQVFHVENANFSLRLVVYFLVTLVALVLSLAWIGVDYERIWGRMLGLSSVVDVLRIVWRQIKLLVFVFYLPSLSCVDLFHFIRRLYQFLIKVCMIDLIEDKRKEFCGGRIKHTFLNCSIVQVILSLGIEFDFYQQLFQFWVKHESWFLLYFHFLSAKWYVYTAFDWLSFGK